MHVFGSRRGQLIWTALAAGGCVVIGTAVAAAFTEQSAGEFTRDVRTLAEEAGAPLPFYAGAVSQLNIMVWASAGSLAMLTAYLQPARRRWFCLFGTLVLLLAVDDALTLHESGSNRGLPEIGFYVVYAVISLVLLTRSLRRRVDDCTVAFLVGSTLLALSVIVDQALHRRYIVEDALKLLGALVWLVVPLIALRQLRTTLKRPANLDLATAGASPRDHE